MGVVHVPGAVQEMLEPMRKKAVLGHVAMRSTF